MEITFDKQFPSEPNDGLADSDHRLCSRAQLYAIRQYQTIIKLI